MKFYLLDHYDYKVTFRLVGEILLRELTKLDERYRWQVTNAHLVEITSVSLTTLQKTLKALHKEAILHIEYDPESQEKIISIGENGESLIEQAEKKRRR